MKTDPVCGAVFAVVAEASAVRRYRNRYYYFCGLKCQRTFDLAPQRFVTARETNAKRKIHSRAGAA